MSVYRPIQRTLANDVFATPVPERPSEASGIVAPQDATEGAGPVHPHIVRQRKREQPQNVVLEHTARWTASLPAPTRPHALLRQYPRIANMIALLWTESTTDPLRTYMESLLVDRRGKRKGFPPDVAHDLFMLREYYEVWRARR